MQMDDVCAVLVPPGTHTHTRQSKKVDTGA